MELQQDSDDALMQAIKGLVRGDWEELQSTLYPHGEVSISGTRAKLRAHYIVSDPNGRQRLRALAKQLAQQIILFCIPRSRIDEARNAGPGHQAQEYSQLYIDAQKLFTTTQKKTGEGSELLLYALLEKSLGIPQVLSKMSFKTNSEMHIHGTDGVHAKLLDNGDLALYWGEAKMYEDVSGAITSCFNSLAPYLLGEGDEDEDDLFLFRHYADTGDRAVTIKLLEYFNNKSMKSAQVEIRGACLIGFTVEDYPRLPREIEDFQKGIDYAIGEWAEKIGGRIQTKNIANFEIEVFAVPVPSAQDFRDAVMLALGIKPPEQKGKA